MCLILRFWKNYGLSVLRSLGLRHRTLSIFMKQNIIFAKNSILDVQQGSEYGYELLSQFTRFYVFLFIHSKTISCYEKFFLFSKDIYVRYLVPRSFFLISVLKCNRALLMHFNHSRLGALRRLFA